MSASIKYQKVTPTGQTVDTTGIDCMEIVYSITSTAGIALGTPTVLFTHGSTGTIRAIVSCLILNAAGVEVSSPSTLANAHTFVIDPTGKFITFTALAGGVAIPANSVFTIKLLISSV